MGIKAYYQDEYIALYHGDCPEILPQLPGEFFVFAEPPYNVGKDYKGWDDSMPEVDDLAFCVESIEQIKRLAPEICIYPPKSIKWITGRCWGGTISKL